MSVPVVVVAVVVSAVVVVVVVSVVVVVVVAVHVIVNDALVALLPESSPASIQKVNEPEVIPGICTL